MWKRVYRFGRLGMYLTGFDMGSIGFQLFSGILKIGLYFWV